MKQSYLRSKNKLEPINTSQFSPKKPVQDYQQYEEQLSSYQKNKKEPNIANLFDWTKPSEIIKLTQNNTKVPQPREEQQIQNNSFNTEQLLRSDNQSNGRHTPHLQDDLDDSIDVQLPNKNPSKGSYILPSKNNYGYEYVSMTTLQLQKQMKQMREKIIDMNLMLNRKLDRYQMLSGTSPNKQAQIANPYQFLSKQIEINNKIIAKQLLEMKQVEEKDKQLQKKDYLVELNELVIEIGKQIHDMGKEKHSQWVDVERIDRLLKEIQSIQGSEDEYREVKQLKIKIIFYFKKLKEHKAAEQQLDQQIQILTQKDDDITKKLQTKTKMAVARSLQVSTNRQFLEMKKHYEELIVNAETSKKKKQVLQRSQKVTEQMIQKQIKQIKKQIQRMDMQSQQLEYKSMTVDDFTNDIMNKHKIQNRQLKSISYRFDQSLIHPQKGKYKPDFKRVISRNQGDSINRTIDNTNNGNTNKIFSMNDKNFNDKNLISEESSSIAKDSHINDSHLNLKPILRSMKGKTEKARYSIDSPANKYKTIESSNIFRPPPLLKTKK